MATRRRIAPHAIGGRRRESGQGVTEMALVLIPFLLLLFGIVDLGRGIYAYNGVAEAARELARVTSVHAGDPLGSSADTVAVLARRPPRTWPRGAVFTCVDITGAPLAIPASPAPCRVSVSAPFQPHAAPPAAGHDDHRIRQQHADPMSDQVRADDPRRPERGQTLVIFALAFVGIVAAMGLVIDGGAAFAFRRDAQNAADLAAMAGANNWLTNHDEILAVSAARSVAATNGFSHGTGGVTVDVLVTPGNGTTVQSTSRHRTGTTSRPSSASRLAGRDHRDGADRDP
jgi:Flp pilus assembly protein TadG